MYIYSKTVTCGEVNPSDYANRDHKTRVGSIYPNLYTQASSTMRAIKETSDKLKKEVDDLYCTAGYDSVDMVMDSVYHYIENEIVQSKGENNYFTEETSRDVLSNVYQHIEIAKSLRKMFELTQKLNDYDNIIKLTKQDVIL